MSDTRTTEASEEKLPPDRERSVIQFEVSPRRAAYIPHCLRLDEIFCTFTGLATHWYM